MAGRGQRIVTAENKSVQKKRAMPRAKAKKAAAASAPSPRPSLTLPLTKERAVSLHHASGVLVVGVDEAGRGPLAGPVVAAAVAVLNCASPPPIDGINDSKQVPEGDRERLFEEITASPALVFGVSVIERDIIDDINILQATMRGMEQAVQQLQIKLAARGDAPQHPLYVLVDGPKIPAGIIRGVEAWCAANEPSGPKARGLKAGAVGAPGIKCAEPVIGGDAKVYSIAAASLVAKVTRDRIMRLHDATYPEYGFAVHKGYGTARHMAAIHKHGFSAIHRRSFQPIKGMIAAASPAIASLPLASPSTAAVSQKRGRDVAGGDTTVVVASRGAKRPRRSVEGHEKVPTTEITSESGPVASLVDRTTRRSASRACKQ